VTGVMSIFRAQLLVVRTYPGSRIHIVYAVYSQVTILTKQRALRAWHPRCFARMSRPSISSVARISCSNLWVEHRRLRPAVSIGSGVCIYIDNRRE